MNEFAKPGLANDQFPPVSATDNGKVLTVADGKWTVANASGGTTVVANPTLAGTESNLTGLQVGDTKYKVPEGGGGGVLVVTKGLPPTFQLDKTWQEIHDASSAGIVLIKSTWEDGTTTEFVVDVENQSGNYVVNAFGSVGNEYSTNSASGYPSVGGGK